MTNPAPASTDVPPTIPWSPPCTRVTPPTCSCGSPTRSPVRRVDAFVYIHAVAFAVWMLFIENNPWPTLTLVVSLEAIFLSTFVMIGQNRQAAFQQAKADHDFVEQELELKTNTDLTRAIHELTTELHRRLIDEAPPAAT